ncbi:MAG: undecaprenyl-diphosphate phosphatase [Bacteroidales bacterium]|nr:undecaprenyl-diphosphate phosphatase [Bacteroidales bacterium]
MDWLQALVLGVLQGLTEFLPVSSSGHLEIGKHLLNVELEDNLTFDIVVHAATVLSTIVVFRKDLMNLIGGVLKFRMNEETHYVAKLVFSAIPVIIIGLFFEDEIEQVFSGTYTMILVGCMLMVTAILLAFTYYARARTKQVGYWDALIIGIAQAIAVLPGMSRSGTTIATALFLRNKREEAARFSFLMVLLPILGKAGLDLISGDLVSGNLNAFPLFIGFVSAFVVGLGACKLMISIVKKSKLIYFALYCAVVAVLTIIFSL